MDFSVEEYKKKQEKKKLKEVKIKRKKTRNQLIAFFIIFSIMGLLLSVTEMGCNFLEDYFINSKIDPFIEQAKGMDNFRADEGVKYYIEDSSNFKMLMKQNFTESWLIGLQKRIAGINLFCGREYKAYKSYNKYRLYFGSLIPEKEVIEILSVEIATSKDSAQYKDCGELIEYFFDNYSDKKQIAEPWYSEVVIVEQNYRLLNGSKKEMNEFIR